MLKKYTAILTMLFAWTILFAHGTVPHDHHDALELHEHHYLSDQHHDSNDHHDALTEAFAHFSHGAEGITLIDSKSSAADAGQQALPIVAILCFSFIMDQPAQAEAVSVPLRTPVYRSPVLTSFAFRGPPVLIG